ncbi:uncharacterized protein MELLADRAFT_38614 [Melampsora larici-populina 98AG31]|uniref:peptidylprolyl isomerase n=1 Tax=Melampsora larici-populina (strain 98AG31 / pathotype 3-4-7) TaxID=747676 RepID=F4RYW9_MELLP|nr:uncharacterized protein MELLADRAFT_38614 [Melampsora larici-populina 98AG31]EGG02431.1 hypothetical protein MELLADRAFT_38614 [Melampsora larici-populina 98AG31]
MIARSYAFAFTWALPLLQAGGLPPTEKLDIKTTFKPSSCPITSQQGDQLAMLYVGTLASNGVRFDATEDPRNAFKFKLGAGEVIKGWDQGLLEMCVGEKRRLNIPSALGYAEFGNDLGLSFKSNHLNQVRTLTDAEKMLQHQPRLKSLLTPI